MSSTRPGPIDRLRDPDADPAQDRSRLRVAAMMATIGIAHFVIPKPFERIVPRYIPWPRQAVAWSGVAEVAAGALIAVPRTRRIGGWLMFVTVLGVYPANIQMAIDATRARPRKPAAVLLTWLRLPLQLPMLTKAWSLTR